MKKRRPYLVLVALFLVGCELPPSIEVYNPGFVLQKFEDYPLGWTYERGLPGSISKIQLGNEIFKPVLTAEDENPVILSQKITVKDSGSYFLIGKFKSEVEKGSFFLSVEGSSVNKKSVFSVSENTCLRVFFSFAINEPEIVTIRIGFNEKSSGKLFPDSLFLYKERYFEPISIDAREMRAGIENFAEIKGLKNKELDKNIDKLASTLNTMYLQNGHLSTELRQFFLSSDFDTPQTSNLYSFVTDWDKSKNNFDQKISITLDEILKLYRIPVRQIYLRESCNSKHQFIEYYNQFDNKWKIIDAYFGIRYIDKENEILDLEMVEYLSRTESLNMTNIYKLDLSTPKYEDENIFILWNTLEATSWILKK